MDHPGFEIVEASKGRVIAKALGGVPVASLRKPTPVLVMTPDGERAPATLAPLDEPTPEQIAERIAVVELAPGIRLSPPVPVVFDLPDFELNGDTIRMRALDDLAGCGSILAALERVVSDGAEAEVYALFTRAEEVGLIGARLLAEQVLISARQTIKARKPEFKCQRQLMSGGTCEATAFAVYGYRATGIAFPLGNYHNATTHIPDPEGDVDAEYISLPDYLAGVELIAEAAVSVAQREQSAGRWAARLIPDDARKRLETSVGR